MTRPAKLRARLAQRGLNALLVSQPENRRYLSGFTGSEGFLLISQERALIAIDFRYIEQAKAEAPEFEIVQIQGELAQWAPSLISGMGRVGFEGAHLPFTAQRKLSRALRGQRKPRLVPTEGLVESLRSIKEEGELEYLKKAAALTDAAFEYIVPLLEPGRTEKEVAWDIERFLREKGGETPPFDIIVASGPRATLPHARPTERTLGRGEPLLLDLGTRVEGYCSDLSRTLCLGEDETFAKVYDIVLRAQLTALASIEAGMSGDRADGLARSVIEEAGYGKAFGHGLGHGIGLAAHEEPRLGPGSSALLEEGMVFTVEPGIYLEGWGGVRIEDMVILEKGKARPLTGAKKAGK